MEAFIVFVQEHIPEIVAYVVIIIEAFITGLVKKSAGDMRTNLLRAMQDNSKSLKGTIREELDLAKDHYNEAVKQIEDLKTEVTRLHKVMSILLEEDTNDDTVQNNG